MTRDDDKELWELLGKSRQPSLSPFFARNVVREVRSISERPAATQWWWFSAPRWVTAVAAALVISGAAIFSVSKNQSSTELVSADDIPEVVATLDAADYEIVADLDDLIASQEDDSWEDTPTL